MPEITKHTPGMFCWADLGAKDVAAAKKFYTALFGWTYQDDPMGPDAFYSRALVDGKDACAIYAQQPDQAKMGVPPHWASYIAVRSADDVAAQVTKLGGKVLAPPFDVFDAGRMTVFQDPTGATISGWQAKQHIGARVMNQPGALCWTELMTPNADAAGKFYTGLGWTAEAMPMPTGTYTVFKAEGQPAAGMMQIGPEMKGVPPHWMIYFDVASCDKTVETCKAQGGSVLVPAQDVPNVGRFAMLSDPQGVSFGVLQPASR